MDQFTFRYDTVLSDVHILLPNARHLMTRLNHVGQPVFISKFKLLKDVETHSSGDAGQRSAQQKLIHPHGEQDEDSDRDRDEDGEEDKQGLHLDEDGDLDITHRPTTRPAKVIGRDLVCPVLLARSAPVLEEEDEEEEEEEESSDDKEDQRVGDVIRIEHTMATPLEDVGKQVWRGAFLLADFILSEADMFRGATVLELGAGMGFTSIVMATVAKTVYCTDVGDDLLSMCERNVSVNRHMTKNGGGEVKVKQLDWLQYSLCTDADVDFSWTEEEVADLYDNTHFIIAADVIYDEDLTDGLFRILYRLCRNFTHTCTVLLSLEKRMNFSLRHMDVCCEAYSYFRRCLSQLLELQEPRCSFRVEQLPTANLAQFFLYERVEQLELWKLTVSPRQSDQVQSEPDLTRPDPTRPDLT
ncbi:methyltransferase-like protein 22 [Cynoglossus semilaevis]|uniref:methyltransferase-like protein 22 n=1 Tax=Cynoglossus semilaevis TaxID=244447 RepID=UPI000495A475|nr:methyltransferase-like protein 22 [Cynoglossus semilaevis]